MHNTSCGSLMAAIFCTIFYKYRFCTDLFCLSVYLSHRHLYLITHAVRVVCTAEICVSHLYRTHAQQTFSVHVQQLCRRSLGAVEYALLGDLLLPRVYEPPKQSRVNILEQFCRETLSVRVLHLAPPAVCYVTTSFSFAHIGYHCTFMSLVLFLCVQQGIFCYIIFI